MDRRIVVLHSDIFTISTAFKEINFIEDLPDELLLIIFSYLDIDSLFSSINVSKRIRRIVTDSSIWIEEYVEKLIKEKDHTPESRLSILINHEVDFRVLIVHDEFSDWMFKLNHVRKFRLTIHHTCDIEKIKTILINNTGLMDLKIIYFKRGTNPNELQDNFSQIIDTICLYNTNLNILSINIENRCYKRHFLLDARKLLNLRSLNNLIIGCRQDGLAIENILSLTSLTNLSDIVLKNVIFHKAEENVSNYSDLFKLMNKVYIGFFFDLKCDIYLDITELYSFNCINTDNYYLFNWLNNCRNLRKLHLEMGNLLEYVENGVLTNEIFHSPDIFNYDHLIELTLDYIDGNDIRYVFCYDLNIPTLRSLKLERCFIDCSLSELCSLTKLQLDCCPEVNQKTIDSLSSLNNLKIFIMNNPDWAYSLRDLNFNSLANLTNLTDLTLDHVTIRPDFYINLPQSITKFDYHNAGKDYIFMLLGNDIMIDLKGVKLLKNLKILFIPLDLINKKDILILASMNLEELHLYQSEVSDMEQEALFFEYYFPDTKVVFFQRDL